MKQEHKQVTTRYKFAFSDAELNGLTYKEAERHMVAEGRKKLTEDGVTGHASCWNVHVGYKKQPDTNYCKLQITEPIQNK